MPQSQSDFSIVLYSFGYKYQAPYEVNFLYDVRSLPNPYWEESLRHLSGMDDKIAEYVLQSQHGKVLKEKLLELLILAIEQHKTAGKKNFHIAIGCTGGRHRSVAMVEFLHKQLYQYFIGESKEEHGLTFQSYHRDIEKDTADG